MINNQKGFTLTELIAGVALTTLLFAGFIMFLLNSMEILKRLLNTILCNMNYWKP